MSIVRNIRPSGAGFAAVCMVSLSPFVTDAAGLGAGLRLGYSHTEDVAGTDTESLLVGVRLDGTTPQWRGLSLGGTFYATTPIGNLDDDDLFLDPNGSGYAILDQLWLAAETPLGNLKVGRQEIDTPFADRDDRGMMPNTFEAALLEAEPGEGVHLTLGHMRHWAGVDSPGREDFVAINGDHGASFLGLTGSLASWEWQGWYYYQKDGTDIAYVEAATEIHENVQLALQWTHQRDRAADQQAMAWGARLAWEYQDFTLSGAFNQVFGSGSVTNGYGGGPFFTSAEHNTIDGVPRIRALAAGIEYGGIENLTLGARHVAFNKGVADEWDFAAGYELSDDLTLDLIHSDIGKDGRNTRVFLNYRLQVF